jgi:hypothetical protein
MGYRSTIITDDVGFEFSEEFFEKYKDRYNFGYNRNLPISSKHEVKRWWDNLEEDIVSELKNKNYDWRIFAVWLHEDGLIDRIVFTKEGVFDYEDWI